MSSKTEFLANLCNKSNQDASWKGTFTISSVEPWHCLQQVTAMPETQVDEQEHAHISQNLAWFTTKVWLKLSFSWNKTLCYRNIITKKCRLAAVTAVSHEGCSQLKGPERTAQLLIPMSHPACQHQWCWCATQERESLCVNEKQAHFVRWCML